MSITAETAKEHANDPAVLCCRAETGTIIQASNLEDPAIFDDLVDSGLLELEGALTIEQVLGARLSKTCDSLCPLTADVVEGAKAAAASEPEPAAEAEPAAVLPILPTAEGPMFRIHIGEGRDIDIELPAALMNTAGVSQAAAPAAVQVTGLSAESSTEAPGQ